MHAASIAAGILLLALVLLDAFQTIILPRRPVGRFRITKLFFLLTWYPWTALAMLAHSRRSREQMYSVYGPLALLVLFFVWAMLLVFAYGLIYFGLRMPFSDPMHPVTYLQILRSCFYVSGTTIFTLGLGDVQPLTHAARALIVMEAGTGLGFVALVIGYVPVLYTAFSNREISVALLDARAGSPPTAGEMLTRHNFNGGHDALSALLGEWERWAATMLETHISYPILCYYRSQHDNQSWLSALTAVLDTCALLISVVPGVASRQAQLTFAMGRHALVDLGHVFHLEKKEAALHDNPASDPATHRLPQADFHHLCDLMSQAGLRLCGDPEAPARLTALRALYEPHAQALADYLGMTLPAWIPAPRAKDQWKMVELVRSRAAASLQEAAANPAVASLIRDSVLSDQAVAVRLHSEEH